MATRKLTGRAAALERRRAQVEGKSALPERSRPGSRTSSTPSTATPPAAASSNRGTAAQGSSAREAARERRRAASAKGKAAIRINDRQRGDVIEERNAAVEEEKASKCECGGSGSECQCEDGAGSKAAAAEPVQSSTPRAKTPTRRPAASARKVNPSDSGRMEARARREAMSKQGKNGIEAHRNGLSSAQMLKQKNPEISSREIARNVRAMRSARGARAESKSSASTGRPSAPTGKQRQSRRHRDMTGTKVHHSDQTTGDEYGLCQSVTGTEYFSSEVFDEFCQGEPPQVPRKVENSSTYTGHNITTSGNVVRSEKVTGDDRGGCQNVTGTEYVGREDYEELCQTRPEPGHAKVSFSQTTRGMIVSGAKPSRSEGVTGNESGTCVAVTGTPYAGLEEFSSYCGESSLRKVMDRTPRQENAPDSAAQGVTGDWPRMTGMTGMERGACANVSGTGYTSVADTQAVCAAAPASETEADYPQSMAMTGAPDASTDRRSAAVGSGGDPTSRISGTFSRGEGKVTGTEDFRSFSGRNQTIQPGTAAVGRAHEGEQPAVSRVTGEGITTGMKITGDDWDRGDRVTGTEGTSSTQRNPTKRGPISAMPTVENKRNDTVPVAEQMVTGSSGGTEKGAVVTVSGGARG
ncbi:MAG: CsoS2 family carboxysome shell protein [Thiohalospira sp.]